MADITLTCAECGATMTLSEYASPDGLSCPTCNKPMAMPGVKTGNSERFLPEHVRRAKAEAKIAAEEAGENQPAVDLKDVTAQIHGRRRRRVRTETFMPTLKAGILFIILATVLGYIRFFEGYKLFLAGDQLDMIKFGGAVAILFFHITIVIEALTCDFLTGLLCLIIPGYSLYYLYTTSDSFWLRSIMLALVIVFGKDFAFYVHDYAMNVFDFVNAWLEAGGTPEPTTRLK
jgi:hypothetical protein